MGVLFHKTPSFNNPVQWIKLVAPPPPDRDADNNCPTLSLPLQLNCYQSLCWSANNNNSQTLSTMQMIFVFVFVIVSVFVFVCGRSTGLSATVSKSSKALTEGIPEADGVSFIICIFNCICNCICICICICTINWIVGSFEKRSTVSKSSRVPTEGFSEAGGAFCLLPFIFNFLFFIVFVFVFIFAFV